MFLFLFVIILSRFFYPSGPLIHFYSILLNILAPLLLSHFIFSLPLFFKLFPFSSPGQHSHFLLCFYSGCYWFLLSFTFPLHFFFFLPSLSLSLSLSFAFRPSSSFAPLFFPFSLSFSFLLSFSPLLFGATLRPPGAMPPRIHHCRSHCYLTWTAVFHTNIGIFSLGWVHAITQVVNSQKVVHIVTDITHSKIHCVLCTLK